jgi:hypothetical protein
MSYEDHAISLLDTYTQTSKQPPELLGGDSGFRPLAKAFGCRYLELDNGWYTLKQPSEPLPADEAVTRRMLIKAMHAFLGSKNRNYTDDGFSILDGLTKNNRWRECLSVMESTRDLAELVMDFALYSNYKHQLRSPIASGVCALLNDWLQPAAPYDAMPTGAALARTFYGDVWANLLLNEDDPTDKWKIPDIVRNTTPPFLHGVAPAQTDGEVAAMELPAMIVSESKEGPLL